MIRKFLLLIFLVLLPMIASAEGESSTMSDSIRVVEVEEHKSVLTIDSVGNVTSCMFVEKDSVNVQDESADFLSGKESPDWWINRIKAHDYNIYDPTIKYPRFLNFCVNVYRWADHTFNTYDNDFVLPTGKNWKVMLKSHNWTDSYAMHFRPHIPVRMLSNVYASLGGYLSFMAVSVGYSFNLSKLMGYGNGMQKRFDFNFNTALFTIDAYYASNDGGTIIRRFGDYKDGHWIHVDFPSLQLENYGADIYYFFNHKRYSQGAVYNFSKYQLRSQGSWILGLSVGHSSIKMDFSDLNEEMQAILPGERRQYNFIYNNFSLLFGYGYNWVLGRRWTFNITALPAVGVKHTFPESIEGSQKRVSLGGRGRMAVVYNHHNYFLGFGGSIHGHWHINPGFYFFNAIITFGATTGFRF